MTPESLHDMLKEAFQNGSPDLEKLKDIKSKLLEIPEGDRAKFLDFVHTFKQRLFKEGVQIPGIEFSEYDAPKKDEPMSKPSFDYVKEFNAVLRELNLALNHSFETLKNYFLLKLTNPQSRAYNVILIYDKGYYYSPFRNELKKRFHNCQFIEFEKMSELVAQLPGSDESYLVFLLLESRKNNSEALKECIDNLRTLISEFETFSNISILFDKIDSNGNPTYKEQSDLDDFLEEVEFVLSSFLTNVDLNYEEEKMIKKLLGDLHCPILEYKVLSQGYSGSKVIEVKSRKHFHTEYSRRYVIKYCRRSDGAKLKMESELFNESFGGLEGFRDYSCKRMTTPVYEGLLYQFAKSDFTEASFPFAKIVNETSHSFHIKGTEIIEKLHNILPFQLWDDTREIKSQVAYELYKDYMKEEETFIAISKILDLSRKALEREQLYLDYQRLKTTNITLSTKICHGDLHTSNFFIDSDFNIYLIDFGMTKTQHSLIDFVALEASIKFNHFPRYLDEKTLSTIDEILLSQDTFNESFAFENVSRSEVSYLLKLIHRNRLCAKRYLSIPSNHDEYFLALYFMTVKQIRYSDMNQRFALLSMLSLGRYLCENISS